MKRKTLKIIGLSLLAGVIVGMGLLARPLVDRLVESVAATDQERNYDRARTRRRLCQLRNSPFVQAASHGARRVTAGPITTCG